jgi:hypothetical protein
VAWYDGIGNLIGMGEEEQAPPAPTSPPATTQPPVSVDPAASLALPMSGGYALTDGTPLQTVEQVDASTTNSNTFIGSNGEVYQEYTPEAADWQKVGPNEQQLMASSLSGTPTAYDPSTNIVTETEDAAPLQGVGARTQEAADQLNSVRPAIEPQATSPETKSGFGIDATGNPLDPVQQAPETNPWRRYLPGDEVWTAITGPDGANPMDFINVPGAVAKTVFGLAQYAAGPSERQKETAGEQAYRRVTGQPNSFQDPDASFFDKIGEIGSTAVNTVGSSISSLAQPMDLLRDPSNLPLIQSVDLLLNGNEADGTINDINFQTWLDDPDNADNVKTIYEQGYKGFTEGRALWEFYQNENQTGLQRIVNDVAFDPMTYLSLGLGKVAQGARGLGRAGLPISKSAEAGLIITDPIFEGLPRLASAIKGTGPVQRGAAWALRNPAVQAATEFAAEINPFVETNTSQTRRTASSIEETAQQLSAQIDEVGAAGSRTPRMILDDDPAGIAVIDPVTSTRTVVTPANQAAALRAAVQRLDEVAPAEYQAMLQTPTPSGKTFYDVLFYGKHLPSSKPGFNRGVLDNMIPWKNPTGYTRYVDHMIGRIDRYGQEVIDDLYRSAAQTFNGSGLFTSLDPKYRVAFAARKLDAIDDILTRGGFTDTDAARHTAFKNRVMTRAAMPDVKGKALHRYLPRRTPFRFTTPRPTPFMPMDWEKGIIMEPDQLDLMRQTFTSGGKSPITMEFGAKVKATKGELTEARALASRIGSLTDAEQKRLDDLFAKYGPEGMGIPLEDASSFTSVTPAIESRIAGAVARRDAEIMLGLRDASGKIVRPAYYSKKLAGIPFGRMLEWYDDTSGALKATMLYNWANVLPFTSKQWVGNASNLGLTDQKALDGFFSFEQGKRIYEREKGNLFSNVMTDVDEWRADRGLPVNNSMRTANRTGTMNARGKDEDGRGIISRIISPEVLRRFAGVSDLRLRETSFLSPAQPLDVRLRQTIRQHAVDRAGTMGVRVTRDQIDTALDALEGGAKNGTNGYTPIALRKALETSGATGNVNAWAERIARDYLGGRPTDPTTGFNGLRAIDQIGIKNMERVGFSFNETRLDAVLNRVFFYHYWNSRASMLYARNIIGNPALLATYYKVMESMKQEAEQNNYPRWLKGYIEFMTTPAGFTVYGDPTATFNTAIIFADEEFQQSGGDPDNRELTGPGKMFDASPWMTNPIMTSMLYWSGTLGSEFSPPNIMGGYSATWKQTVDLINLYRTQHGMPLLPRNVWSAPNQVISNRIANLVSGGMQALGLDTNLVEIDNFNASQEVKVNWMVQTILTEQHPDWNADRVALEAAAIQDNDAHPVVMEANARVGTQPFLGAVPTDKGGPVGAFLGGFINDQLSPIPTMTRPTMAAENQELLAAAAQGVHVPGAVRDAAYLQKEVAQSAGPEDLLFEEGVAGYGEIGTPEQQQAADLFFSIGKGEVTTAVQANGKTYTPDQIKNLSEERRWDLARVALADAGLYQSFQAYRKTQDAYKAAHPEMVDYFKFKDVVEAFPGTTEDWAQEAIRVNPDFARYVADRERLNPDERPNGANRERMLLGSDAYRALMGMPSSIYDVGQRAADQGPYGPAIPGMPVGISPTQWQELQDKVSGSGGSDYQAAVQQDIGNFTAMLQMMNEYDATMGYPEGTSAQQYVMRVVNGKNGGKIDSDLYTQIDEAFGYVFPSKTTLKNYLSWMLDPSQNPTGVGDIEAFMEWDSMRRSREALGKPDTAAMEGTLSADAVLNNKVLVRAADGSGFSLMDRASAPQGQVAQDVQVVVPMGTVRLLNPANPYQTLGEVPPGIPLTLVSRQGDWALIETPDGVQGYVPVSSLSKAA